MGVRLTMSELVEANASTREPDYAQPRRQSQGELELGWDGVASALTRILIGYSMILLQLVLAVMLIWYMIASMPTAMGGTAKDIATMTLIVVAGFGIIGLLSLFSCIMIFTGKCRCAVNAPELGGARWLIFCCILCLAAGTLLGLATSIFGTSSAAGVSAAKTRDELFKKLQPPTIQEVAATCLNLAATVLFVLFLRAVGKRFESRALVGMADLYLFASAVLIGVTVQVLYFSANPFKNPTLLLGIGLGWLLLGVWYVSLILVARLVLAAELARPRSSLSSR